MLVDSGHEVKDKRAHRIPKEARAPLDAAKTGILRKIEARFEAEPTALGLANAWS